MNRWTELTEALSQLPIFENVNSTKKQLDGIRPLSQEVEGRVMQKLRLDWNYNSNAIEGNKLTYGETHTFIMYGLTAKGKPLKDHLDIKGHDEAIKFIGSIVHEDEDLREVDIRNLHQMILVEPYKSAAQTADGQALTKTIRIGEYKQQSNHVITLTGETHYYATPEEVPILMRELVDWYNEARKNPKIHPSVLAAFVHHRFVNIHPFDDGNGRLARILMNLILMKNGYPPAIIKLKERTDYYAALNQADKNEYQAITELIAETVLASMNLYLKAARGESIEDVSDLDKEISLFKGSLKKTHMKRNDELIKKVLKTVCKPLTDNLSLQLDKLFEGLTFSKIDLVAKFIVPNEENIRGGGYPRNFSYKEIKTFLDNNVGDTIFFDFNTQILYEHNGHIDFKIQISIKFRNEMKYEISFSNDNIVILEKYYDDEVSEEELSKASTIFKKYAFEVLKKKIAEANEK